MAHGDPARVELSTVHDWREADSSALTAIREVKAQLIGEMPDALQASVAQDSEHLLTLGSADVKSAIVVPVIARGHTLGAMTLVSAESGRVYGDAEVAFAQELASRAALVVENARLREDLQHAVTVRDEFLASVSHDLRNPLAAIKATAQVLKLQIERRGSIEPDRLAKMLGSVDDTTTRMSRIIEELLDVTRIQLGRPLELDRQPTDIVALAQTVADEYQRSTTRHTIRVKAETEVVGIWDPVRLNRVVSNLVDNAVKYSPDGGTIRLTVGRDGEDGREAVITIRDEGLGIPDGDLPHIFDRFRRGSNVGDGIAGIGIGLASVRQIIEQHGGRVSVESWVGQGTEVKIRLPLPEETDQARELQHLSEEEEAIHFPG
jgi:signal transduction histidine kinase